MVSKLHIDWKAIYSGSTQALPTVDIWGAPVEGYDLTHISATTASESISKFSDPIGLIPWTTDFNTNVLLTLDWLTRDHRSEEQQLSESLLHNHVKEFWFHNEFHQGYLIHICFPTELLSFRMQYESAYNELKTLPPANMSVDGIRLIHTCKDLLWKQWRCFGKDGYLDTKRDKPTTKILYRYECSRCGMKTPKGIKMFLMLTQSKLKDA